MVRICHRLPIIRLKRPIFEEVNDESAQDFSSRQPISWLRHGEWLRQKMRQENRAIKQCSTLPTVFCSHLKGPFKRWWCCSCLMNCTRRATNYSSKKWSTIPCLLLVHLVEWGIPRDKGHLNCQRGEALLRRKRTARRTRGGIKEQQKIKWKSN